jgi:hypothetical protein
LGFSFAGVARDRYINYFISDIAEDYITDVQPLAAILCRFSTPVARFRNDSVDIPIWDSWLYGAVPG